MEKGGATVFPTLKTVVNPVMGSAVLWYNLNSDGTINYDLLHGGCPVLYGTKWSMLIDFEMVLTTTLFGLFLLNINFYTLVANKWIRSNNQMFLRQCRKNKGNWEL